MTTPSPLIPIVLSGECCILANGSSSISSSHTPAPWILSVNELPLLRQPASRPLSFNLWIVNQLNQLSAQHERLLVTWENCSLPWLLWLANGKDGLTRVLKLSSAFPPSTYGTINKNDPSSSSSSSFDLLQGDKNVDTDDVVGMSEDRVHNVYRVANIYFVISTSSSNPQASGPEEAKIARSLLNRFAVLETIFSSLPPQQLPSPLSLNLMRTLTLTQPHIHVHVKQKLDYLADSKNNVWLNFWSDELLSALQSTLETQFPLLRCTAFPDSGENYNTILKIYFAKLHDGSDYYAVLKQAKEWMLSALADLLSSSNASLVSLPLYRIRASDDNNRINMRTCFLDIQRVLVMKQGPYEKIRSAFQFLYQLLVDHGPSNVSLSFNGGKDCTLLLHLLSAARHKYAQIHPDYQLLPLSCLYVTTEFPFHQVDAFVRVCAAHYALDILAVCSSSMKSSLQVYLDSHPVSAIVVGNRRTDPYSSELLPVQLTDSDWPSVLRAHPLLDWCYADVWNAIFALNIPYCPLYDKGYTSLGARHNTLPNPHLIVPDSAPVEYYPAFWEPVLSDDLLERNGRP